jgi:glycine cleavage system aminomethyltransferase T
VAEAILAPLTKVALPAMKYYGFEKGEVAGVSCLVSRTGYTGEDGFELYGPWEDAERLWHAVLSAGAPRGSSPRGSRRATRSGSRRRWRSTGTTSTTRRPCSRPISAGS